MRFWGSRRGTARTAACAVRGPRQLFLVLLDERACRFIELLAVGSLGADFGDPLVLHATRGLHPPRMLGVPQVRYDRVRLLAGLVARLHRLRVHLGSPRRHFAT